MDPLGVRVADDLETLQRQSGLSKRAVSRRAGYGPETFSSVLYRVRRGEQTITLDQLRRFAAALDLDVTVIVHRREAPTRKGLVNVTQAAALVGVHQDTVRKWVRQGHLQAVDVPGVTRLYDSEDVKRVARQMKASWSNRERAANRRGQGDA